MTAWLSAEDARRLLAADAAVEVAPRLLGAHLTSRVAGDPVTVRITEVEAYAGERDPGSHAYRGRTPRTAVMFGPPGRLYCYLSHGLHHCLNVVTGPEGTASAVLLRAGEVVAGAAVARRRRPSGRADADLARGPGRLGAALGAVVADTGTDLLDAASPLRLRLPAAGAAAPIAAGPRVGLRHAADLPWRFWFAGDPTVSPYRRSPRAGPARPPRNGDATASHVRHDER